MAISKDAKGRNRDEAGNVVEVNDAGEVVKILVASADVDKEEDPEAALARKIAEGVAAGLKDIKAKMDALDAEKAAAIKKSKDLEALAQAEELKRLQAAGEHQKAAELMVQTERETNARLKAEKEALEKQNVELTRDATVRALFNALDFRNRAAADMAFREVVEQLVRDETGSWKHRTGVDVQSFVELYAQDPEKSFLFKTKTNSGSGSGENKDDGGNKQQSKSLFDMKQNDVLALAMKGQLPNQRR